MLKGRKTEIKPKPNCNDLKFSDKHVWANSADPDQTANSADPDQTANSADPDQTANSADPDQTTNSAVQTQIRLQTVQTQIRLQIVQTQIRLLLSFLLHFLDTFEPRHDKTNKMTVRPTKTQISLGIQPV